VSFILDALRKSEHERQRSAVPGLSQVPAALPEAQLPRWAVGLIIVLAAALLMLGAAWWRSMQTPAVAAVAPIPTVERSVEIPPPSVTRAAPSQPAPSRPLSEQAASREEPALVATAAPDSVGVATTVPAPERLAPRQVILGNDTPADAINVPSAASLAAAGVPLPTLHLELHAYSARPRDRFVFINGRKYTEGERLPEGPVLEAIEPGGAVLSHAGRRFMIVQE